MKLINNKIFNVALTLLIIFGLSAPLVVQASQVNSDPTVTTTNGNDVTDTNTFGSNFPKIGTTVEFLNNLPVTIGYTATELPPITASEFVDLIVYNSTGVEWASLTVEFLGLNSTTASNFSGSGILPKVPNPHLGALSTPGTTVQVDYTNSDASAFGSTIAHLTIGGAMTNFPALQDENPFSIRVTPTAVLSDVPLPAAVWFFATGLLVLFGGGRYSSRKF